MEAEKQKQPADENSESAPSPLTADRVLNIALGATLLAGDAVKAGLNAAKNSNESRNVTCPHCAARVTFTRNSVGRWVGRVVGGGVGWWLAASLGLAGTVIGFPVAISAAAVGLTVGAVVGNNIGKKKDDEAVKCPKCSRGLVL